MNYHIFYAHIRNQITTELLKEPNRVYEIEQKISFQNSETIYTFCSEAAHIFYSIQNLLSLKSTGDISNSVQSYTNVIFTHLSKGEKLPTLDLILAAAEALSPLL
ncbi:hypothetical protein KORDIASMS9_01831 [Kordia sp. SMS9]|uniref:hypothetical protein n=1 Tax=Kordia sp. SMS9 TaxID=2282170 RepID=UPI000E0D7E4E|nr:hypothetical protein [Kordia sp. SMS9]AXG69606.1 hypothetical protein KORDIASMS9_01831 [Kordia sp. SMS9]